MQTMESAVKRYPNKKVYATCQAKYLKTRESIAKADI
ncbi:hypothetical protein FHR87_000309 [Azomonas macrocytogenes]|uniref:Uncharacterized protein n=1 Tax=Azomonas macrocytogenes TaxID=69962 RepID=A0A839SZ31_AZOMA|nr:hypothetical protein [Azomonas macrocytogenes]